MGAGKCNNNVKLGLRSDKVKATGGYYY